MFTKNTLEQSSSLVDQAAQSADHAIKSTQRVANDALDSLADSVHDLRQQAEPLLHRASGQVSALAQRGVDSVRETSQQLRDKAQHASATTVNYVKHEPIKAILIAAATGAALMALISLLSHSRHRN